MTNKRNKLWITGGASFLVLLFLSFVWSFSFVTFEVNGQLFYTSEETFSLAWIHSVEKEAWTEDYEISGDVLLLTETRFKTFGAGVPSTASDSEQTSLQDGFVVMQINRSFPSLDLVVSTNVNSTLVLGETRIPLFEWAGDYETVTISVKKMSLWDAFLKGEHL